MPVPPRGPGSPRRLIERYDKEPLVSPGVGPFPLVGQGDGVGASIDAVLEAAALTATSAGAGGSSGANTASVALTGSSAGVGGSSEVGLESLAFTGSSAGAGGATGTLALTEALSAVSAGIGGSSGSVTQGATAGGSGGAVPRLEYLHPTLHRQRPFQPLRPVRKPLARPRIASITADDILALWASDALSDSEALAALEEVHV